MDELEARIETLERAVTDGDHDLSELATEGETRERVAALETEVGELADQVSELEAATQALRGYVGNVRAVNRDIEQRADTALAKAESVESALDETGQDDPGETQRGESGRERQPRDERVTRRAAGSNGQPREAAASRAESDPGRSTENGTDSGGSPGSGRQPTTNGVDTATGSGTTGRNRAGRRFESPHEREHGTTAADDSRETAERAERCDACGQPTTDDDTGPSSRGGSPAGQPASREDTDRQSGGATGVGRSDGGGLSNGSGGLHSGGEDPLGSVFESGDSPDDDADGTFDRIRQML
jgi:hypothetical protein